MHPRDVLLGARGATGMLPVCDHYSGVESRMRKSLQLQTQLTEEFGACVFDITLDCEDGAAAGIEQAHAGMVAAIALQAHADNRGVAPAMQSRVGVRVHAVNHPAFAFDVATILEAAAPALRHVMVPKVETVADVEMAVAAMDAATAAGRHPRTPELHVLIESPLGVAHAFAIAAHPRVASMSFGLMDFVSAHGGVIPASAMALRGSTDSDGLDQFHHPLVVRAKLEIASACHAHGKVASHCVVTEFRDTVGFEKAVRVAKEAFGYGRMWSIHPDQIRPIVRAFAPSRDECDVAAALIALAASRHWAPVAVQGVLHDRASYRYFWQVLERAHRTGVALPSEVAHLFIPPADSAPIVLLKE